MLVAALRECGEDVKVLNLSDLYADIVGPSETYNPLHLIADLFWNAGHLQDISDYLQQLCQLLPEPKGSHAKGDNKHFRDGSRRLIAFAIQVCILTDGYRATLGDALQLLSDRETLKMHAQWVAGRLKNSDDTYATMPIEASPWANHHDTDQVANYCQYIRAQASGIATMLETKDSKTFENFISDALEALSHFNITTRAHHKTKSSSFRFSELKEGDTPTTIFLMMDASKRDAQAPIIGLLQFCMLHEIKIHPNKKRPVYLIADEATNIPWSGLGPLMTWSRSVGLKLHFIFQTFPAFEEAHGKAALEILLSECDIVQVLAGQKNPTTLKMLETMLSNRDVVTKSRSSSKEKGFGASSTSLSEASKPVMTADQIRRSKKSFVIIKNNKALEVDLPSIAEIHPWRKMVAGNPHHDFKPYLKRITLRIGHRKGALLLRPFRALKSSLSTWRGKA